MSNEVFRFSVLRPFQKIDPEKTRSVLIKIDKYVLSQRSDFYQVLKKARDKKDRETIVEKTKEYRKTPAFITDLGSIMNRIDEVVFGAERLISVNELVTRIETIFKDNAIVDWKTWIKTEKFHTFMGNLSNSLIACSIATDEDLSLKQLRPRLVRGIRLVNLLERLASDDKLLAVKNGIARALTARVLLPKDIFPLPHKDTTKERAEILESYEQERKRTEKQQAEIFQLMDKIERFRAAKSEIIKLHKQFSLPERETEREKQLKDLEAELSKAEPKDGGLFSFGRKKEEAPQFQAKYLIAKDAYWNLTASSQKQLTKSSLDILNEIGVSTQTIDVRNATTAIDKEISALSDRLYANSPRVRTVKVGNTFFSKGIIRPLVPEGFMPVSPAQNGIDLLIPDFSSPPLISNITVPSGIGVVQPIGHLDYKIVREELLRYEPGEIADIENVLMGESKVRSHKRTTEREEISIVEEEKITESERDHQTANRFELKNEAQNSVQQKIQAQGGIEATYKSPCVEVKANAGFTYERATQESNSMSINISHEVIDKTVSKIQDRVREYREIRTKEIIEEINQHTIENAQNPKGHIRGIYRWVDKIHKAEIVNIGRRLMFEFIIPEPAAFFKYAEIEKQPDGITMNEPEIPVWSAVLPSGTQISCPLRPELIYEVNYRHWAGKYNVQDVKSPPQQFKIIAESIQEKPTDEQGNLVAQKQVELSVEDGYEAVSAYIGGSFINHPGGYMRISVGKYDTQLWGGDSTIVMSREDGKIPVTVMFYKIAAIGLTIEVTCERKDRKFQEWQLSTYASIMNAYNQLKSQYDEQVAAAKIKAGIQIQGRNPLKNKQIEETELKKTAISLITGQDYRLFDAMCDGSPPYNYPEMDSQESVAEGKYIQFFEQAFEWHNMSYTFYPYFWGRKENWIDNLHLSDTDPEFEKFLQAGSARVLVPVRPSYEQAVLHYLETGAGVTWEGGDPPHVEDDLFISIVDSIKEEEGNYNVEGEGELSVIKNHTLVTGTGTAFTEEDDENREIFIRSRKYRIAHVEALDRIYLCDAYKDNDEQNVPYELGVQFVGEPWEVRIPTSLVWLQDSDKLPDLEKERKSNID